MIKFQLEGITFEVADLGGGWLLEDIPRHSHSKNSYELHFITGGKGKLITDTKEYNLKSGNLFITGPNIYHSQTADKENPVTDIFIYLQVNNRKESNTLLSAFLETHFWYTEEFENETAALILEEYKSRKLGYNNVISGLMMKLITEISRCYMQNIKNEFKETEEKENLNDRRFVIIENTFLYNENTTLKELSEKLGLCERQTQRLLQKYYGKSFREKKNERKNLNR